MTTSHNKRKVEHTLFLFSVWIKGLAGVVETIGGLMVLFVTQKLARLLRSLSYRPGISRRFRGLGCELSKQRSSTLFRGHQIFCQCLFDRSRPDQDFPGSGPAATATVGISIVALVSRCVHRLSVLSLYAHTFDMACAADRL